MEKVSWNARCLQIFCSSEIRMWRRIFITGNQSNCIERFVTREPSPQSARWLFNTWKSHFIVSLFPLLLFLLFKPFDCFSPALNDSYNYECKWRICNTFALNLMIACRGERSLVCRSHLHAYASHKLPRTSVPFTKLSLDESNRLITICLPYAEFYTSRLQ